MTLILEEVGGTIKMVKIDAYKNQLLASKYQLRSLPTMVLFKMVTI